MGKKLWSIITNAIALTIGAFTLTTPIMADAVNGTNGKLSKRNFNEFNFKSFNTNVKNYKDSKEKDKDISDNGDCHDFVSNVSVQGIGTEELFVEFNLNKVLNISLSQKSNIIIKCYDKNDIVLISKFKYYDEYLISANGHAYGLSMPILQVGKYFIKINNKDTNINVLDIVKVELVFIDDNGCSKKMIF
ncbi:MAG: hypothetical protein Q4B63_09035 [Clostridium perfringens]|nr:hypothetical protein [Clostridium perfringens]